MMVSSTKGQHDVYDLVGLGFGPANLAIASALTERWSPDKNTTTCPIQKALFIERHERFRWHPGMLLPGAKMQISFMKDLATLRSPQSPMTFLSYLHSQNRLVPFINRGSTIPTRKEYADYLSWAAQVVQDKGVDVMYGHEVTGVAKGNNNTIEVRSRSVTTGEERVIRTRDLIISPGGAPRIPEVFSPITKHPFLIHSSAYATSIDAAIVAFSKEIRPLRVAVVGSGQSAAEVSMDLRTRLGLVPASGFRHTVDVIIRKGSLKPSDDSPFANEIFDPTSTDAWFNIPSERIRASRLAEYKSTNYGVVNPRTLEALYEIVYEQKLNEGISRRTDTVVTLEPRIHIRPYSSIISTSICPDDLPDDSADAPSPKTLADVCPFTFVIQDVISRAVIELKYDIIVCATGYQRSAWIDLLRASDIGKYFGVNNTSSALDLLPSPRRASLSVGQSIKFDMPASDPSSEISSPASLSSCSTPPTSPGPPTSPSIHVDTQIPDTVYISRNYQLLPLNVEALGGELHSFKPRIYLQGMEEATHGLSDTLLSVLGVRAGEVVEDLCKHRKEINSLSI